MVESAKVLVNGLRWLDGIPLGRRNRGMCVVDIGLVLPDCEVLRYTVAWLINNEWLVQVTVPCTVAEKTHTAAYINPTY